MNAVVLLVVTLVALGAGVALGSWASPKLRARDAPPEQKAARAKAAVEIAESVAERRRIELQMKADEVQAGMRIAALEDGAFRQSLELADTMASAEEVGPLLRAARKNLDLTQRDVRNRTGIKEETLSSIELGRAKPDDAQLRSLARVLGLDYVAASVRFNAPVVKHHLALAAAGADDD